MAQKRFLSLSPAGLSALPLALLLGASLALGGCEWLAMGTEKVIGKEVISNYPGLIDKSLVIVVYADPATTFEYPAAREEISAFVTGKFQKTLPSVKLVDYKDIIRWQDDTFNWQGLPEKDWGRHFSTQRVLYIELLEYSTREPGSQDLLRGRIRATCKVFETDAPGQTAAWTEQFKVFWPTDMPELASHSNDLAARRRVLEAFSEQLVNGFYDHREREIPTREKSQ